MNRHSLREQMGQLKERERVLIGENDQLRAQLVEMKEQEKKKYDDLMVQYNMKREYEDDGTSNNQVTVKTEWDDEEVKQEIKVEIKEVDDEKDHDIIIKQEYVPAYLKTESNDVKVEIKEEIKEEEDNDEDSGWDRCLVKKELNTADMIEIKEEVEDGEETRIIDMETLTEDRQVKREIKEEDEMKLLNDEDWVKREIKEEEEDGEMVEVKEEIKEEDEEEEEEDGEAQIDYIESWVQDNQSGDDESRSMKNASMDTTLAHSTGQSHNASNSNESIDDGGANLTTQEQLLHTLNEPNEVTTVTQSADLLSPSTSTAQTDNPTELNQQATASTGRNGKKRRQPTSNRSAKRPKKTIEEDDDEEDGEDIANDGQDEAKVKVIYLNCTESNCNVKLDSLVHLHDHLSTVHRLAPLQCFATNCDARFDNRRQFGDHLKLSHSQDTRFMCAVCPKEYDSQNNAYNHWYKSHLTGQLQCNFVSDCAEMTDTRGKMLTHQKAKHHYQLKLFPCTHPGCTSSFSCNSQLKRHELIHLNTNPFRCNWPHCSKQCNRRSNLVMHIRTQHFGLPNSMKKQKAKNIVDLRDPNEYVRVVEDE